MTCIDIDMAAIPAVIEMQNNGILVDVDYFHNLVQEFRESADVVQAEIEAEYGRKVNVRSPGRKGQLSQMLQDMGVYSRPMAVDAETLAKFSQYPIVRKVQQVKEYEHLISQFAGKIPEMVDEQHRLHCDILLTRTATSRPASKNPNLQNQPVRTENGRKIRKGFIASPGCKLLAVDWSQLELRIAAHLSGCPVMRGVYLNDGDIHATTAAGVIRKMGWQETPELLKEVRRPSKSTNFGTIYMITAEGLWDRLITDGFVDDAGSPVYSVNDCQDFIDSFFETYHGYKDYLDATVAFIKRAGYIETMYGFRRWIPGIYSSQEYTREKNIREGVNTPIQGTGAGMMKMAMAEVLPVVQDWNRHYTCHMLMTIHDELLFEIDERILPPVTEQVVEIMENVEMLSIPVKATAKIGDNWAEMMEVTA
jgi:DNA polymerase-1